jgi:hypothetical protein
MVPLYIARICGASQGEADERLRHPTSAYLSGPPSGEALPLQQFPHQLGGGALVSSALYQQVGDFAFVINGAPEIHRLATDPSHHLVEVPTGTEA